MYLCSNNDIHGLYITLSTMHVWLCNCDDRE